MKAAAWERSFIKGSPFPLGDVLGLVAEAHRTDGIATYPQMKAWLSDALDRRGTHRLLRPYVEVAVENVLDAHDVIEAVLGPLRLIVSNPLVGPANRQLTAWGPLYATEDGTREIRRVRLGSAHEDPSDADMRWAAMAAHVAAVFRPNDPPGRVRVVEIGAADGSTKVLFDGTPTDATALFHAQARDKANHLVAQDHVVACSSCGDCKAAGACTALLQVDGMLGQTGPGVASRSIAPTALEKYATCPAQWLLDADLHLPKEDSGSEALDRGNAVHRWLEAAHGRGVACAPADLPDPAAGAGFGLAEDVLTREEYDLARPYLTGHVDACPLAAQGAAAVAVEQMIHGWDATANLVAVTRPDLLYRVGDRLIIRETKTMKTAAAGQQEAYDRHLQVPFMLVLLASGLAAEHGVSAGSVELEVLGPDGAQVWAWSTDDPVDLAVARADVRRAVESWHLDTAWSTRTGPHCAWCPVRRWCPDRDDWQASATATATATAANLGEPAEDEPPF
ncbi:MAG: PD-(D/E)XK nuclease family protein [Actinomycetes bacterium]